MINMRKLKLLLVDDEKDFVKALAQRLGLRGFSVDVVYNGVEAITYLTDYQPDLIILDIKMPLKSGIDVLQWLTDNKSDTPVIVLTGYINEVEQKFIESSGVVELMQKPPDFSNLLLVINATLK